MGKNKCTFFFIVSPQVNIRNTFFDQNFFWGWSKTARLNNLWKKTKALFYWKLCHRRPILGLGSLTRGLPDNRKWVFCDGADRQTNIQTDMAILWLNRPREGRSSEKLWYHKYELTLFSTFLLVVLPHSQDSFHPHYQTFLASSRTT